MPTPPAPLPPLIFRLVYACYAWPVFLLLAAASLPVLLALPRAAAPPPADPCAWRPRPCAASACASRPPASSALPHPCVVVANHESYLDGVVLAATLPADFGFVIKREMRAVPAAGWLLERIGAHFVDRKRRQPRRPRRARACCAMPSGARRWCSSPRAPSTTAPGLLPFRNGAFAAAQRAGLPLVPLVIRGTRRRLPPGTLTPWPGRIGVTVLAPLHATLPGSGRRRGTARPVRARCSSSNWKHEGRRTLSRRTGAATAMPPIAPSWRPIAKLDALRNRSGAGRGAGGGLARLLRRGPLRAGAAPAGCTSGAASAAARPGWSTSSSSRWTRRNDCAATSITSCATCMQRCASSASSAIRCSRWRAALADAVPRDLPRRAATSATSPTR